MKNNKATILLFATIYIYFVFIILRAFHYSNLFMNEKTVTLMGVPKSTRLSTKMSKTTTQTAQISLKEL